MNNIFLWLFFIAFGFLSGSIMFSRIIPLKIYGIDIEKEGSDSNPGSANVFMKVGVSAGFLCLFLDIIKGFLPVYLAVKFTVLSVAVIREVKKKPEIKRLISVTGSIGRTTKTGNMRKKH